MSIEDAMVSMVMADPVVDVDASNHHYACMFFSRKSQHDEFASPYKISQLTAPKSTCPRCLGMTFMDKKITEKEVNIRNFGYLEL